MAAPHPAPKALLFDLDGTLIDSMPLHQSAWGRWHGHQGLPFDEDSFFESTAGRSSDEILLDLYPAASVAERAAMGDHKEALYRDEAMARLELIAGALDLLAAARQRGLKLAICTAAPLVNIEIALQRFGLGALVDTLTSPADGLRGKPHPDIFEEAARRLGVAPADCLVFEDAPLGIEAARRAGMCAVALTTTLPAAAFAPYPNLIATVEDFTSLDRTLLFV
ncbi:MAG TPA: HAD family phosphatase [Ideonella sp.]|nr:HAD family phosphatase [Ideonella sp.]